MSVDIQITGQGNPDAQKEERKEERFDLGNCMKRGAFSGTIAANMFANPTLEHSLLAAAIGSVADIACSGVVYVAKKSARMLYRQLTNPD